MCHQWHIQLVEGHNVHIIHVHSTEAALQYLCSLIQLWGCRLQALWQSLLLSISLSSHWLSISWTFFSQRLLGEATSLESLQPSRHTTSHTVEDWIRRWWFNKPSFQRKCDQRSRKELFNWQSLNAQALISLEEQGSASESQQHPENPADILHVAGWSVQRAAIPRIENAFCLLVFVLNTQGIIIKTELWLCWRHGFCTRLRSAVLSLQPPSNCTVWEKIHPSGFDYSVYHSKVNQCIHVKM